MSVERKTQALSALFVQPVSRNVSKNQKNYSSSINLLRFEPITSRNLENVGYRS
jgi:hypothetical protein